MIKKKKPSLLTPLEVIHLVLKRAKLAPEEFVHEVGRGYVVDLGDELYESAVAYILKKEKTFLFYIDFRNRVESKRQAEVAEYLTRANAGIVIGNFEMYYSDGVVRYKTSIGFEGSDLFYSLVRNAISAARNNVERYGESLVKVMRGEKSAKEAIREAEISKDS